MNDQATKWILGIASAAIIAIGIAMVSATVLVREDLAVMKSEFASLKVQVAMVNTIQIHVMNHEYRIGTLERSDADNTRTKPVCKDGTATVRSAEITR
jgi:hypothetical protein